ncbi:MAG: glycine cleavage system aminomethyltransferase GcvT [Pirellulaceae bacterium]
MAETTENLLATPLRDWHVASGGRMVEFAGWLMPVQYSSIIDEHHATRNAVGIFDVSHMGRFYFSGSGIEQFIDGLTTRRIIGIEPGRIRYSLMTNAQGTILDDILVYHLQRDGNSQYMMVVNAGNRLKIKNWIESRLAGTGISLDDRTERTAMIAVQGPKACGVVAKLGNLDPVELKYYSGAFGKVCGKEALISRTGYTGEDGCELIVDAEIAEAMATAIANESAKVDGRPAGLGARDTLRLEAAMPLYGHELTESINAVQTDLGFAMNLKDRDFVGRDAIMAAKKQSNLPVRVGLIVEGKRAARENCDVLLGGKKIGFVTSGTYSPTLQKAISMAYVDPQHAAIGTAVEIDIRGKPAAAEIVKMPFYSRS